MATAADQPSQHRTVEGAAKRVTKRRGQTRRRLLEAALEVFAEQGFGRSTVEQICERAGYTRGAFYSNFSSLDELFLAMWEERSRDQLAGLGAAFEQLEAANVRDGREIVERLLEAVPVDDRWYRITAEFTAHALRNPHLREVMAAREGAIAATITPILEALLHQVGRSIPDLAAFGQALVAVHDGTTVQCLIEPENSRIRERRAELFVRVVMAYTKEEKK